MFRHIHLDLGRQRVPSAWSIIQYFYIAKTYLSVHARWIIRLSEKYKPRTTSFNYHIVAAITNGSSNHSSQDFVIGLSILLRGSLDDKLRWTFSLYDQDRDGFISREEMEDVVGSIFDLMGRTADPLLEEEVISERVDTIFEVCSSHKSISKSRIVV